MRTAARVGALAVVLVTALGLGWATGSAVGPVRPRTPLSAGTGGAVALERRTTELAPGKPGDYAFTLTGALDGPPGLAVVRLDGAVLVHATPVRGQDGGWHALVTLPAAGPYRVVVTVDPAAGPPRDLAADLLVPGPYEPAPAPPSRVAEVDGYQVRLDGDLQPGAPAQVFATVGRDGAPVTDLEPVGGAGGLPAFGRLEAVHLGDLAVTPVHPDAAPSAPTDHAGPGIAFTAEVPAAGTYRLFLDFRHGDVVRTAAFTVEGDS